MTCKQPIIIMDVDGTLTDGNIYIDNNGIESKAFNVKDGMAISIAIKAGLDIILITSRTSKIVELRAKELGIKEVYQNVKNKIYLIDKIVKSKLKGLHQVVYIGDDLNDLEAMKLVGYSACPVDAAKEVKNIAKFISSYSGGKGAVREILEHILKDIGLWKEIKYTESVEQ